MTASLRWSPRSVSYDLNEHEALRNRLLLAGQQVLVGVSTGTRRARKGRINSGVP